MKYVREIQVLVDDFRAEVIRAILTAFPGRAVDNEDPNDDTFLIDGVPVRVESDRIVVGDDLNNYIPLKNPPVAGNPPQYRSVDSVLVDFRAYVNKEKREARSVMKTIEIKDTLRVPGTKIFLEEGDKILYKAVTESTEEGGKISLTPSVVRKTQAYWKKLCKKYKTAEEFSSLINQWDGDRFFEFMADALGLDLNEDDEILERMEPEFYEKVTDPIEIEVFGKPVSSDF